VSGNIVKKSNVDSILVNTAKMTNEDEITIRSDCKVCNSQYRLEAEKKFVDTGNNSRAAYLYLAGKGETMSYSSVYRHMIYHFLAQERNLLLKEYSGEIDKLMQQKYDKRKQLMERISMLTHRMYMIENMSEGKDLKEMLASADATKKLCDSITSLETELDKMDQEIKPVEIILNNLKNAVSEEMKIANAEKNENMKNVLMRLFERVASSVEDILV